MPITRRALVASALLSPLEARARTEEPTPLALRPGKLALVEAGETDVWTINGGVPGHAMRVLHLLDDGWEPYWRDSVVVPPGATVRVAFVADNPGKWLIESTILDHAMSGLAAWFEVG